MNSECSSVNVKNSTITHSEESMDELLPKFGNWSKWKIKLLCEQIFKESTCKYGDGNFGVALLLEKFLDSY